MTIEEYRVLKEEILRFNSIASIVNDGNYSNYDRCISCQGKNCCQHFPCAFSPEEFLDINNVFYMRELLETGVIVLSKRISIRIRIPYIRPRGIYDSHKLITARTSGGNTCSLLTSNGCLFDPLFRPTEGLLTIPKKLNCFECYGYEQLKRDWTQYKESMYALMKACKGINVENKNITPEDVEKYKRLLLR